MTQLTVNKPGFVVTIPNFQLDGHVFPMSKYQEVYERLIQHHILEASDFSVSESITSDDLALVHDTAYLDDLYQLRLTERTQRSELPLTQSMTDFYIKSTGGTLTAGRLALSKRIGVNIGGGFHHAFAGHAEGFCYLNDIAFVIRKLQSEKIIRKAMVIDCDLHQGNGTAHIFKQDPDVFTFSMHQQHNYPPKESGTMDIGLPDYIEDEDYLDILQKFIPLEIDAFKPDFVVYVAGADPFCKDQLGALKLSFKGLLERDEWVMQSCLERQIPLVVVLGGGYSSEANDTIEIHLNTCITAINVLNRQV